jgi:hypothetical protein
MSTFCYPWCGTAHLPIFELRSVSLVKLDNGKVLKGKRCKCHGKIYLEAKHAPIIESSMDAIDYIHY